MQQFLLIDDALHSEQTEIDLDGEILAVRYCNDGVRRVIWRGMIFEKLNRLDPFRFAMLDRVTRVVRTGEPWQYIVNGKLIN